MAQPRISVVVPVLNQVDYVERALCSVLDQGYPDAEIIVVDGGSTDGSLRVVNLYRGELAHVLQRPDTGPAEAINRGVARATGDAVGILFADDLLLPGALSAVARAWQGDPGPRWIVGRCLRIDEHDRELGLLEPDQPADLLEFLMHDGGLIPTVASFWDRRFIQEVGAFDMSLQFAFDYEFWCRLLAAGRRPKLIGAALAARREHDASRSVRNPLRMSLEYVAAARRHGEGLALAERCQLWANCDRRERILALAQAEAHGQESRRFLVHQLVKHPWWLANPRVRRALVHGMPPAALHIDEAADHAGRRAA